MNADMMILCLKRGEKLRERHVRTLFSNASEILFKEPNVLNLRAPISVCGDIHGQFPDLLELFMVGGELPTKNYLFLGDYVDRGCHSLEVFLFLLALKVKFPSRLFLIRGNHETKDITQVYGFYDEVLYKYGSANIWLECLKIFNVLPICALVTGQTTVFCAHGGLSPKMNKIDEVRTINRNRDIKGPGILTDLLWSDPEDELKNSWESSPRGAGYLFGVNAVEKFNLDNNVDYVARAHQLAVDGFKWHFDQSVLTIWSAPNYCYRHGNVASIYELSECGSTKDRSFVIFDSSPFHEFYESGPNKKCPPKDYFR